MSSVDTSSSPRDLLPDPARGSGCRPLRKDAERNRQRILAAARAVFAQRGLAATLDDVARHACLGVGTVYRRFSDKDDLVEALFEDGIRRLVGLADEALGDPDAWSGLVAFLEGASRQMADDRGLREAVMSPHHGRSGIAVARAELEPRLEALVARAQASGQLRTDVSATDFVVLLKTLQVAADIGCAVTGDYWTRHLGLVLDGLRASPAGSTPLRCAPLSAGQLHEALAGRTHRA